MGKGVKMARNVKSIEAIAATVSERIQREKSRKESSRDRLAREARQKAVTAQKAPPMDATPERLAKEPDAALEVVSDDTRMAAGITVRRFRSTHLDRLHKNGQLTRVQWSAGDWYRDKYKEGHSEPRVTAKYGERVPGGEPSFGLPRSEAQLRVKEKWLAARSQWTQDQQGFMDRMLIRDEYPRYGGSKAMRNIAFIRRALDVMAEYLRCS